MAIAPILKCSRLRRWLCLWWLRRNRARLALLLLEGEHLSEFGRQAQKDIGRELSDRIRGHRGRK